MQPVTREETQQQPKQIQETPPMSPVHEKMALREAVLKQKRVDQNWTGYIGMGLGTLGAVVGTQNMAAGAALFAIGISLEIAGFTGANRTSREINRS